MARLQTYGKVRKRHIRPKFDFSSPEKDQTKSLTDEKIVDVTSNLQQLDLTKEVPEENKGHQPADHVLSSKDANAAGRNVQNKERKDTHFVSKDDEERDDSLVLEKSPREHGPILDDDSSTKANQTRKITRKRPIDRHIHQSKSRSNQEFGSGSLRPNEDEWSQNPTPSSPSKKSVSRKTPNTESKEPLKSTPRHHENQEESCQSHSSRRQRKEPIIQDVPEHIIPLAAHADEVISFTDFAASISPFHLTKVTEATYSEVYRLTTPSSPSSPSSKSPKAQQHTTATILKLIPLQPPPPPSRSRGKPIPNHDNNINSNSDRPLRTDFMSPALAVRSEIQLLRLLAPIPGFTLFRQLRLLRGAPSPVFLSAYATHRELRTKQLRAAGCDEEAVEREFGFPDPRGEEEEEDDDDGDEGEREDRATNGEGKGEREAQKGKKEKGWYGEGQWWALLEMEDAGTDLEGWRVGDVFAVWDVFWGVALAVGKGEASVGFEHRDLHAGNVCVRVRDGNGRKKDDDEEDARGKGCLRAREGVDLERKLGFTGVEVTVIDYTNSRAELSEEETRKWGVENIAYKNLEDELDVFETRPKFGYQYRIPRFMRDLVLKDGDPEAETLSSEIKKRKVMKQQNPSWREYHPKTNLLWLHFLLYELMDWTKEIRRETKKKKLVCEKKGNTQKGSGRKTDVEYRRVLKESDLESKLLKVESMLMPQALLKSSLNGVGDLVEVAWRAGWLDKGDILG
ncbi:MAG: hypothetical protein M1822_006161 [Bathelium mastoideum]|nr:MAG: hypothetical protein M1822_006161 [Bathelium mastoideum]